MMCSTHWKEYTSPDGRKYYYNKATKESKWTMPEELKKLKESQGKCSRVDCWKTGLGQRPSSTHLFNGALSNDDSYAFYCHFQCARALCVENTIP